MNGCHVWDVHLHRSLFLTKWGRGGYKIIDNLKRSITSGVKADELAQAHQQMISTVLSFYFRWVLIAWLGMWLDPRSHDSACEQTSDHISQHVTRPLITWPCHVTIHVTIYTYPFFFYHSSYSWTLSGLDGIMLIIAHLEFSAHPSLIKAIFDAKYIYIIWLLEVRPSPSLPPDNFKRKGHRKMLETFSE